MFGSWSSMTKDDEDNIYESASFARSCIRAKRNWLSVFHDCGRARQKLKTDALLDADEVKALLRSEKKKKCAIGLIADVQYADVPDGPNFEKTSVRYFRHSLVSLRKAVRHWSRVPNLKLVVNLGDLIDGRNKASGKTTQALRDVSEAFKPCEVPIAHVIGNHELYNLDRAAMAKHSLLRVPKPNAYHVVDNVASDDWMFIVLDSFEISTISSEFVAEAWEILASNNPNVDAKRRQFTSKDWAKGLEGPDRRFVPFNGGLTKTQLSWLSRTLSQNKEKRVIIFSHIATYPGSCGPVCLIWNYEDVLSVIRKDGGGRVVAFIAGHDHHGGYAFDPSTGVHHVTLASPLETPPPSTCHGVLELFEEAMLLHGSGLMWSLPMRIYGLSEKGRAASQTAKAVKTWGWRNRDWLYLY